MTAIYIYFYRCCLKCFLMIEKTSCAAFTIAVKSTLSYFRSKYFIELYNLHTHADRILINLKVLYFLRALLLLLESSIILILMPNFRSKGLILVISTLSTKNKTKKSLLLWFNPALLHRLSLYLKGLIRISNLKIKNCFKK